MSQIFLVKTLDDGFKHMPQSIMVSNLIIGEQLRYSYEF
ncbi:hypothetical protein ACUW92_000670 [Staphylococcus epidermidis]|nr:hypothetical protein SEVCU118_1825 [Staphylococcus epidermidis VCU118]